jgi:hypothetical protein
METSTAIARVQESLLALEINRFCDAFQGGDAHRREAVDQAAAWFAHLWQEDRRFFQKTALPLVAFHAFNEASEDGDNREGPLATLLQRLVDSGSTEERKESVVRHVVDEYRAFVTVLGEDEASTEGKHPSRDVSAMLRFIDECSPFRPALLRVTRCFLSASSLHTACVETLAEVFVQCVTTTRGKKALLQRTWRLVVSVLIEYLTLLSCYITYIVFELSERLTPVQKVDILLHVCTVEPAANIRELAARSLQSFTVHIPSATSAVRLLADKSQKVRLRYKNEMQAPPVSANGRERRSEGLRPAAS